MKVKRTQRDFLVNPEVDEAIRMPIRRRELKLAEQSEDATERMLLRILNVEVRRVGRAALTYKALERYRRAAERERQKAFQSWMALTAGSPTVDAISETNPTTT
jgi:hypothetical protein